MGVTGVAGWRPGRHMWSDEMLRAYIVYFKFVAPGDKKPGGVKQYRLYANSREEARRLAAQQSTYPNIEVLRIVPA